MYLRFVLVFLGLASHAMAKDFIVGGQDISSTDPIQASTVGIYDPSPDGKSGALCTGTLIRKDMAVTAAHCLSGGGQKPSLIFGPDLHSPLAERRSVEAIAINPKWKTNRGIGMDQGDIALVKFGGNLPAGYKPVRTVSSDQDIRAGSEVTLAGYGISNAQTKTGAGKLRRTEVSILQNRPGKSEMILDQSHGRGACHGDSGGPAFLRNGRKLVLAGVTNRGYPPHTPDDCGHQVVYTKLPAYKSWIQKSTKKLEANSSEAMRLAKHDAFSTSKTFAKNLGRATNNRTQKLRISHSRHSKVQRNHKKLQSKLKRKSSARRV